MFRRLRLALIVAVSATILGYMSTSFVQAQQQNRQVDPTEKPIAHKKFAKWGYEASQIDKAIYVRVLSDIKDKASLQSLLAEQRSNADALFASTPVVHAVVLLNQALDPDDLANFTSQYNLSVQSYTLLAQDRNDDYITFFGAPVDNNIFPKHILQSMVKNIEENQATKLTLKGVVSIDVKLDTNAFKRLYEAGNVLGVDLTPALALHDLKSISKEVGASLEDAERTDRISITSAPFYWITAR